MVDDNLMVSQRLVCFHLIRFSSVAVASLNFIFSEMENFSVHEFDIGIWQLAVY